MCGHKASYLQALIFSAPGTTGDPKPISITYRSQFATSIADALVNRQSSTQQKLALPELNRGTHVPILLPLSWLAGLSATVSIPLYYDSIPILLPASMPQPVTASYVSEVMKLTPKGERNGINFVPNVLRSVVSDPVALERLKQYDWIMYAGAPLDHPTGDLIFEQTGVRVQAWVGSTETGTYPLLLNEPADWKLHRFHPDLHGFYFEHFSEDLYELCIKRQEKDSRHCFATRPGQDTHRTRDLWRNMHDRKGFWANAGRVDDFVKLATLAKFNAVNIEQVMDRNPAVAQSLVAGDARDRPFAIIEPTNPADRSSGDVMNIVWPAIDAANENLTEEAKLIRALVLIADPDMPIVRTAKGTTDRRGTLKLYEQRIEELYEGAGYDRLPYGADRNVL